MANVVKTGFLLVELSTKKQSGRLLFPQLVEGSFAYACV